MNKSSQIYKDYYTTFFDKRKGKFCTKTAPQVCYAPQKSNTFGVQYKSKALYDRLL